MNCLYSFKTKIKLELHKKVCGNKYFYKVVTSVINTKKLIKHHDLCRSWKFNRKYWCKNNSENWFVTKLGEHFPSDFPASSISSFRSIENKHDVCRGKDFVHL